MKIPIPLIKDISEGRCLPFIGAGFSKNAQLPKGSSMPNWGELVIDMAHAVTLSKTESPLKIAQEYEHQFGRVELIEAIRVALFADQARPGVVHNLFAALPFDTIYTTNFDLLLEDAYAEQTRPFRSLVGELQLPFHAGQTASNLVKMHGDLRHEEHIIVTQDDYDQFLIKYPVIATHLSAMLITRTPLFIGYSQADPDFQNIRKVVRERLGKFERMSYMLQFDVPEAEIEKALEDQVHLISLNSDGSPSDALKTFFQDLQEELDSSSSINLRASRPDIFENVSPDVVERAKDSGTKLSLMEATSKMAFVLMPFQIEYDMIYREVIVPTIEKVGLISMRADEMSSSGLILEQIRTAINESRIIIADVSGSNPNVLYEVGYAQALGKPLILIADNTANIPFDLASQRIFIYGDDPKSLNQHLEKAINTVLSENRLAEATRLLEAGHNNAAISTAAIVLEQYLRKLISKRPPKNLDKMSIGQLVHILSKRKDFPQDLIPSLRDIVGIRNSAVHGLDSIPADSAEFVLRTVRQLVESTIKEIG